MKIEDEIKQSKFKNEYQKANINLLFTAAWLSQRSAAALKAFNISWQQFNVLRILRGMHPETATVKLITERMIDKMSNASRLVDKLKAKGYVERTTCPKDRRRVDISITKAGLEMLEDASAAMDQPLKEFSNNVTEEEVRLLNEILDKMRS